MSEPFDYTKPAWTRDGQAVPDLRLSSFMDGCLTRWRLNGRYQLDGSESPLDLTNTPPAPKLVKRYVAVFQVDGEPQYAWSSLFDNESHAENYFNNRPGYKLLTIAEVEVPE